MKVQVNEAFCIDDCVFADDKKAVIFSPFTSETLLCERIVLDFLSSLIKAQGQHTTLNDLMDKRHESLNEITEKLVSMRIILLKE